MFLSLRDDDWNVSMGWWCWGLDLAGMLCGSRAEPGMWFQSRAEPGMLSRSRAQVSLRDGIVGCGGLVFAGCGQEDLRYWGPDFAGMIWRSGGNP